MRQFFKFVLASCLGLFLAGILLFGVIFLVIGSAAAGFSSDKAEKISPNSVLHIDFKQVIPEKTNNTQVSPFDFKQQGVLGLHEILGLIKNAETDKNIKAVYVNVSSLPLGQAGVRSIREALKSFKTTGKPVIAYSHYYTQGNYYLASVADKVYLNPIGSVSFTGFGVIMPYFKNMLDKIGVEMQVFYAGQFKSATEPFRSDRMSDQNRLQVKEYLDGLYEIFQNDIAESRNISVDSLNKIADEFLSRNAESALSLGLIDGIVYEDQVTDELKSLLGIEEKDKLKTVGVGRYANAVTLTPESKGTKDKIALIFAEGTINDGEDTPGEINGDQYVKLLKKVREDKNVKAVVMRINSGGGSVLASDRILREVNLIREKGIPVVVSMADVAASGGYYIACSADKIFVEPGTITGSIGVFTLIPNTQKLMNDKLGITFDTVRTNRYSTSFNTVYKFDSDERQIMQESIEEIYERFLNIVAEGRKMTRDQVHEVAQGRVWIGKKAVELGLVDEIGSLETAMETAASLAGIDAYRKVEYPRVKDPLQQLLDQIMGNTDDVVYSHHARKALGEHYYIYDAAMQLKNSQGLQARLPFVFQMK